MKNIAWVLVIFLLGACETGTIYDKNTTKQYEANITKQPTVRTEPKSILIEQDIEALLDEDENEQKEPVKNRDFIEQDQTRIKHFQGGKISDGLDVNNIREGKHDGYIRLVFDIQKNGRAAKEVGAYHADYIESKNDIVVTMEGYRDFSAALPSFSHSSNIELIYFEEYLDDSGYKFHIKLRNKAKVRIFALSNPARLVFDIKAI